MLATSLLTAALLVAPALAGSAGDWRTRTIYQLLTDRFATPDGSSPTCNTGDRKYCGGTWKGITTKLDYIQGMGFDSIWISPVVANVEGKTAYGEAFHGYWTQNIDALNPHFGTADDLVNLSRELHKRNMYLMVDVVVNHVAAPTNPPDFSIYTPFNQASQFHPEVFIQGDDYTNNQTAVEQGWLGDTNLPLADINTEDPNIVSIYNNWISALVKNYTIDGIRIDTVKHVRQDFWPDFAKAAGVYTVGEVLDDKPSYLAPYTKVIDSVLDYSTYFKVFPAFSSTSGNMSAIADFVQQAQGEFSNGEFFVGSFIENHDQPRLQSATKDQSLVMNAMAWPFVQDGIPILYYGQEQGFAGGNDPDNREALWSSGYATDKPLVQHVKKLNAARRAAASALPEFYANAAKFLVATPNTLAVSKPPMLALLSNSGSGSSPQWDVPNAGFKANEELVDVVGCGKVKADGNGGVSVKGNNGMPQILMPSSAAGSVCSGSGTQGSSASRSPVHVFGVVLATVVSVAMSFL